MLEKSSSDAIAAKNNGRDPHQQLRIRAAWLYYVEGLTQSDVAKRLKVNRVMITRILSEARSRGEVTIRIKSDIAPIIELQHALEERFGLHKAVLAPFSEKDGDPTKAIAFAAAAYISQLINEKMKVGVGWGRTLQAMLPFIEGRSLVDTRVISLLGGIAQARRFNPAEFAWQFAELFNAEGFLIPAPAIVDSEQTKYALLEHCGLEQVFQMAETCDVALLSCGGITTLTTSYRVGHVTEAERKSLVDAGAVGDLLYNFLDKDGNPVDHPVNRRAISMPLDRMSGIREKVLMSGGSEKVNMILAILKTFGLETLVTDEITAKALLETE
ncbi:MAG: sugar-binding transcriptional regulator [Pseudomonadota bacterium]